MNLWIVKWVEYNIVSDYYPAAEVFIHEDDARKRFEELLTKLDKQSKSKNKNEPGIISDIHFVPIKCKLSK